MRPNARKCKRGFRGFRGRCPCPQFVRIARSLVADYLRRSGATPTSYRSSETRERPREGTRRVIRSNLNEYPSRNGSGAGRRLLFRHLLPAAAAPGDLDTVIRQRRTSSITSVHRHQWRSRTRSSHDSSGRMRRRRAQLRTQLTHTSVIVRCALSCRRNARYEFRRQRHAASSLTTPPGGARLSHEFLLRYRHRFQRPHRRRRRHRA